MSFLRLALVADDPLARAALSQLLVDVPDCTLVAQMNSADMDEDESAIDLIVWDVGWESTTELPEWLETVVPILALLPHESDAQLLWQAGVRGLLPRQLNYDQLATAVQAISHKLIVIDPAFAAHLTSPNSSSENELSEALTPRELDVLQLLAEGLTNKAIAQQLAISDHTVKFHVNAIMGKLNAQSRTEAVVRATRLGLILL